MQYLTYNQRGSRAFDRRTEKIIALALTLTGFSGLMAHADPQAPGKTAPKASVSALQTPQGADSAPVVEPGDHVIQGQAAPVVKSNLIAPKVAVKRVSDPANDVTIDFVAADINDVLRALALQTRSNIVSGTDVKGNITVSLAHVSLDQALNMISKLSGYEYAKVANSYVVGSPASISSLTQGQIQSDYVHFDFSDSGDLMASLGKTFPSVRLSMVKPAAVTEEISGAGGGEAKTIRRTGGVISVTGTIAEIASIKKYIGDLEGSFPESILKDIGTYKTDVYPIKYSSADDLQNVLSRLVPRLIVTPGPVTRQDGPGALFAPISADAGTVTTTVSTGAQPSGEASGTGSSGGTSSGTTAATTSKLAVKPKVSSLLLTGADSDIAHAHSILDEIDIRPAQITYEAKVTEISLSHAKDVGLVYDFSNANTIIGEDGKFNTLGHKTLSFGALSRTPLSNLVNIQLNALIDNNDAKILASPNISAVDGQPAAFFVGDTVSYISSITQSATGQNITTSTVNAGIKLYVSGKVNNDGMITLNIHPEVSLVTLSSPGTLGIQVPDVRVREVTTTVRVHDGEVLAIGGLINDQQTQAVKKVPFFGDLPFFGNLFRNTNRSHIRDEVVIFLKVSIQKEKA